MILSFNFKNVNSAKDYFLELNTKLSFEWKWTHFKRILRSAFITINTDHFHLHHRHCSLRVVQCSICSFVPQENLTAKQDWLVQCSICSPSATPYQIIWYSSVSNPVCLTQELIFMLSLSVVHVCQTHRHRDLWLTRSSWPSTAEPKYTSGPNEVVFHLWNVC